MFDLIINNNRILQFSLLPVAVFTKFNGINFSKSTLLTTGTQSHFKLQHIQSSHLIPI